MVSVTKCLEMFNNTPLVPRVPSVMIGDQYAKELFKI